MCGGGLEPTVCLISALNHHWYNNNIAIGVEPMYAGRSLPNTMYRTLRTDWCSRNKCREHIGSVHQANGNERNRTSISSVTDWRTTCLNRLPLCYVANRPFSVCKGCAGIVYLTWITSIQTRVNQYPAFACHVIPLTWFNIDSILLRTCHMPGRFL